MPGWALIFEGIAEAVFALHSTGLLGTLLLIEAGMVTALASQIRPAEGWGWFLFDAMVTFLAGAFMLWKWPSSSLWAIGTLVGIAVLMGGITRVVIASRLRKGAGDVDRYLHAA